MLEAKQLNLLEVESTGQRTATGSVQNGRSIPFRRHRGDSLFYTVHFSGVIVRSSSR